MATAVVVVFGVGGTNEDDDDHNGDDNCCCCEPYEFWDKDILSFDGVYVCE